jgi:hypothetical protein
MTSIVYRIGACGTGLANIVVGGLRRQAKRGDRRRIAARNCGYETTISFNYLDCIDSHGSQLSILYIRVPWAAHNAVDSTHSSNAHARRRHAHRPRATGGTQDPRRPPRCGGAVIVICTHLADALHSPR